MDSKKPIISYEFGTLYIAGDIHKEGDTPLSVKSFDNLWNFILSNKVDSDTDVVMSVHTRGGKKYIKTGRYVGTIQTKDGQIIEILPKIYKASGKQEEDQVVCRKVFLNMLRHFTDAKAKSFQNASLGTKKGFPILEVYISNYINAIEQLLVSGLKKNYTLVAENQKFLKGKLDVGKQITKNLTNKTAFAIQYNKYIENIPQNRIIVSTLNKLLNISHNNTNKAHISALLTILADIPLSTNIETDLKIATTSNRLFADYDLLMKWSSQFLLNRGFTTFSGSFVNQSLLFKAEKLFEDFIAYLFKKHAPAINKNVDKQNTRYFLVDRHNEKRMFQLRPDILVESDSDSNDYECIIIDTKWKAIDSTKPDKNYLLDMKDMYQLYAYGQKYKLGESKNKFTDVVPKLILIYPYSEKFTKQLPEFIYEDVRDNIGLKLMVVPFDLTDTSNYEKQIHNIIKCASVDTSEQPIYKYQYDLHDNILPLVAEDFAPYSRRNKTMLVGCYKDELHLKWILEHHLYNVRLGKREGAVNKSGMVVSASRLLLYDNKNHSEYKVFELNSNEQVIANNEFMQTKNYPGLKLNREYLLYIVGDELNIEHKYDVEVLKEKYAPELKNGAPFYVQY